MSMTNHRPRTRTYDLLSSYSYFTPNLWDIIKILLFFLLGQLIGSLILIGMGRVMDLETVLTYGTVIVYPLAFIPAMLYASVRSRKNSFFDTEANPLDRYRYKSMSFGTTALLVSITTLALGVVIDPISQLLPEMSSDLEAAMERLLNAPLWLSILSVSIFAPIFEEWLCRGMILRGLLARTKPVIAILVSGLIFGLIHGNIWQAIPATLIGAFFGYVYWKTGSLKLTMLMHCVNNTMALIVSRIDALKDLDNYMDMFPDTWAWLIFYVACLNIVILCIYKFQRKDQIPENN